MQKQDRTQSAVCFHNNLWIYLGLNILFTIVNSILFNVKLTSRGRGNSGIVQVMELWFCKI